jgi:peptidoglycan/LPS O-acetylase OafA/YrhL
MSEKASRIAFIDGLRGIAILAVILFHAFTAWHAFVPYGSTYAAFPLFKYGYLGVELFFLISGFVILMTLEKCHTFSEFMWRRWKRLFPAMALCSALIFLTAGLLPERPAGAISARDLIPGLSFIEPSVWTYLLGTKQGVIEGAFWSLYVEFKFYAIFGALFFLAGRTRALAGLAIIFFVSSALMNLIAKETGLKGLTLLREAALQIDGKFFIWFLAGALSYQYYVAPSRRNLAIMTPAFIICCFWQKGNSIYAEIAICALFLSAVAFPRVQATLSTRSLLFLGFISYPLYLIHENAMIALIVKFGTFAAVPGLLLPVLPVALLVGIAWMAAAFAEPFMRKMLDARGEPRPAMGL